jgi:ABC-2 type transport system ATP-binding protein
METIASLDHVTKAYGATIALDDVSLTVHAGVTAVLGPNGAGKSTMIRILAGLHRPGAGQVRVLGGEPQSAEIRGRIGLTPQTSALPLRLTVSETLDLLAAHYPRPYPRNDLVKRLDLDPFLHKRNGTLSGGQQRRVALAAALVGGPDLAILDEPTSGLDADSRESLWDAVGELAADGCAVLLASHDMAEVERLANRVVVITEGRISHAGTVAEIRAAVGVHLVEFAVAGALPAEVTVGAQVERFGGRIRVYTPDPDAVVRRLVRHDVPFQDLRVDRAALAEAIRHAGFLRPKGD